MRKWHIAGIDNDTGFETTLVVEATSEDIARVIGERKGIQIATITEVKKVNDGYDASYTLKTANPRELLTPLLATTWASFILGIITAQGIDLDYDSFGMPILYILTSVLSIILWAMHLYRLWGSLPAKYRRTTPAKAVGLSFIPIYNFYWLFTAVHGLSNDLYTCAVQNNIKVDENQLVTPALASVSLLILYIVYAASLTDGTQGRFALVAIIFFQYIAYTRFAITATDVSEQILKFRKNEKD